LVTNNFWSQKLVVNETLFGSDKIIFIYIQDVLEDRKYNRSKTQ